MVGLSPLPGTDAQPSAALRPTGVTVNSLLHAEAALLPDTQEALWGSIKSPAYHR